MDLLTADFERANSRVAEIERRNEKLRAEIELVRSGSESAEKVKALEAQISELQSEAERFMRSLESQKEETEKLRTQAEKRQAELVKESEASKSELESLREKVKQYSDYDEVKRELEIMKVYQLTALEDCRPR
jgi:homeobox protein cut-like